MLRQLLSVPVLLLLAGGVILSGCDGEPVDQTGARYDIVLSWMGGSSVFVSDCPATGLCAPLAVYGSLGVAAPTNKPGARQGAMRWQDAAGNFWLFGGRGHDAGRDKGRLHDLWKFDPVTGLWTWMGGVSAIGGTTLYDGRGIYGTQGIAEPANLPGARSDAVTWLDTSGDLWLFGGFGHDRDGTPGRLNDLWKLNTTTGEWTWVGGGDVVNQPGSYVLPQGTADAANQPGTRYLSTGWVETAVVPPATVASTVALWLFGGEGFDGSGACCSLNDLWRYDIATGEWAWMTGSDAINAPATFGTAGVAAAVNTPSGRFGTVSWRDSTGAAWVYGGTANDAAGGRYVSAELWRYTPAAGWAWVSGTQSAHAPAVHNARGVAALNSTPGSRTRASVWLGADNTVWLFGGYVEPLSGTVLLPNDLWQFKAPNWTWAGGSKSSNVDGRYSSIGGLGQPGGRASAATWIGSDGKLWLFGGEATFKKSVSSTEVTFIEERDDLWRYTP